jgi:hypothetical protein
MEFTVRCPGCSRALPVAAERAPEAIRCGGCGREVALTVSEALREDRAVDLCPVCGGTDFYVRKDFDPKTGLLVVIAGALVSGVFYWFGMDMVAYGILAAAVLVDLVIAFWLGDVTICYRCHAEFRGRYPRTAPAFDLHTADVLEHEYARKIGKR